VEAARFLGRGPEDSGRNDMNLNLVARSEERKTAATWLSNIGKKKKGEKGQEHILFGTGCLLREKDCLQGEILRKKKNV